jgi:hypothetical protein
MYRRRGTIDGVAMIFFVAGGLIVIYGGDAAKNLGWILIIIGIVKQMFEWK